MNVSPVLGPNDKNQPTSVKKEMGLYNDIDVELFINRLSEALIKNLKILETKGFIGGLKAEVDSRLLYFD